MNAAVEVRVIDIEPTRMFGGFAKKGGILNDPGILWIFERKSAEILLKILPLLFGIIHFGVGPGLGHGQLGLAGSKGKHQDHAADTGGDKFHGLRGLINLFVGLDGQEYFFYPSGTYGDHLELELLKKQFCSLFGEHPQQFEDKSRQRICLSSYPCKRLGVYV